MEIGGDIWRSRKDCINISALNFSSKLEEQKNGGIYPNLASFICYN